MTRLFQNKATLETTADYGKALSWAANGETVSEFQKVTEFGGD